MQSAQIEKIELAHKPNPSRLNKIQIGTFTIVALLVLVAITMMVASGSSKQTTEVEVGDTVFRLWVANTEPQRIQGLSGVSTLAPNGGLFMDFQADDTWGIWMKDMRIPLDIVWLDKDKKVVHIVQNAQPETPVKTVYRPSQPTRYVLELSAGSVKRSAIQTGITVKISDNK